MSEIANYVVDKVMDVQDRVVVVRMTPGDDLDQATMVALSQQFQQAGASFTLFLRDGTTIERLDEAEMHALGWVRCGKP